MNRVLLSAIFLLSLTTVQAQTGYLFVKKGIKKKMTFSEYDNIYLKLNDGTYRYGMITRLMNDTIYVSGRAVPRQQVAEVIISKKEKRKMQISAEQFLLITGGVALVTAGLTLSKQAEFNEALAAGLVIGYGPLGVSWLGSKISFGRKKYVIGRKFRLQVLDFYVPRQRGF